MESDCQVSSYRVPANGAVVVVIGWRDAVGNSGFLPLSALKLRRGTFECFAGRGAVAQVTRRSRDFQVNVMVGDRASAETVEDALAAARSFALVPQPLSRDASASVVAWQPVASSASPVRPSRSPTSPTPSRRVSCSSSAASSPWTRTGSSWAATTSSRRPAPCSRTWARSWRPPAARFADVVKVTVFLTDIDDRPLVNPVRQEVFGDARPASTLVEVSALVIPGARIEVDAVALIPA